MLGVGERPGRELERELPAALRDERSLIVLDNCEHLIGACARLVEGLLRRCPGLAVLATSREPLGSAGERVWPVPALSVPDSPSLETASRCESARLFTERAAAVSPGFELTEANAPAVAEVCRRLDGIPLAIELAASRVRTMTVAQISARLDDALGLLASGPRTAPERQRTLRATIDWSYDLLSPAERAVFRALSVFSGGFSLEAAEEVCQAEAAEGRVPVFDLLSRLVDKSLVGARRTGEAARYRLQEVIHQYASEKLEEAGEADAMRQRHAVFFGDFAEEAEPDLSGPDPGFWLNLVDEDLDNLRAAMSWASDSGDAELGLRLSSTLAWFWLRRGRLAEGRASVERALNVGEGSELMTAKAIHVSGGLAWAQGDRDAAGPLLSEAVARFRELDDYEWQHVWLSSALSTYSLERLARGETREALTTAAESIEVGRRYRGKPRAGAGNGGARSRAHGRRRLRGRERAAGRERRHLPAARGRLATLLPARGTSPRWPSGKEITNGRSRSSRRAFGLCGVLAINGSSPSPWRISRRRSRLAAAPAGQPCSSGPARPCGRRWARQRCTLTTAPSMTGACRAPGTPSAKKSSPPRGPRGALWAWRRRSPSPSKKARAREKSDPPPSLSVHTFGQAQVEVGGVTVDHPTGNTRRSKSSSSTSSATRPARYPGSG